MSLCQQWGPPGPPTSVPVHLHDNRQYEITLLYLVSAAQLEFAWKFIKVLYGPLKQSFAAICQLFSSVHVQGG